MKKRLLNHVKSVRKLYNGKGRGGGSFSGIYERVAREYFDAEYYLSNNPDVEASGADPFEHFVTHGWEEGRLPFEHAKINERLSSESENSSGKVKFMGKRNAALDDDLYKKSGLRRWFDESYYLQRNPDVAKTGGCPFTHFMEFGWIELRNPSPSFDLIWYTQHYLGSDWTINPLEHYHLEGKALGHLTSPRLPIKFSPPVSYPKSGPKIKRICLFAAYDPDGLIDDVVVEYIAALAKHADVYFLSDCHVSPAELERIKPYTKGAWAHRHGLYDFGSWSQLAKNYVGWDKIDKYDELLLINDSAFLLGDLDEVFNEMDNKACDWWGLQATKGLVSTLKKPGQVLPQKTRVSKIKEGLLERFEGDDVYDFHLGSYFVVYRKPVKENTILKDLLNSVEQEDQKIILIQKYEIGITRLLISCGHEFETFEPYVYPFHPLFTEESFDLVSRGFPLFKKYHLIENQYGIKNLFDWEKRLKDLGVSKDLKPYSKNLRRTGNAEKIYRNQDIDRHKLNPPLSAAALIARDKETPKYKDWWVFPVCAHSHLFNDNVRAIFEFVKNDPSIKKIVLTRSKSIAVEGVNVHVLPLNSAEGQFYLLRSKNIFLKHSVAANIGVNLSKSLHSFHNLWHGIPLKRIGYCSIDLQQRLNWVESENRLFTSVISASKVDQLAMSAAYWPLTVNDIWLTGLPRHDLITMDDGLLPNDMRMEVKRLKASLSGKKLIIFAPTFRLDQDDGYYDFSDKDIKTLKRFLNEKGYVLGIREHMTDRSRQYSSQLKGDCFIDLNASLYPNVEVVMKEAIALITDYSSIFIDFLVTGKPVISFAYDYEHYFSKERGLFYDLDWCFPGEIVKSTKDLFQALSTIEDQPTVEARETYEQKRKIFMDYQDGDNSKRVYDKVIALEQNDLSVFEIEKANPAKENLVDILWVLERGQEITARYRIFNLAPEFTRMGLKSKIVYSDELTSKLVKSCSMLIFSRVSYSERLLDFVHAHQLLGKKFVFDIDDLNFNEAMLEESEFYHARPNMQAKIRNTSRGYKRFILEADVVTVTTSSLAQHVEKLGKLVVKVPNSLSAGLIERFSKTKKTYRVSPNGLIRICYLSGTKTHGDDFRLIHDAAKMIMAEHPEVEFHVVGDVAYDEFENEELLEGWVIHEKMNYEQMHNFISTMDINLCPLLSSNFNDSKSELKFFEAALHGVPTIASPSKTYEECIRSGENGFLATSEVEWVQCIFELIKNDKKREAFGRAAKKDAIRLFAASSIAKDMAVNLDMPVINNVINSK